MKPPPHVVSIMTPLPHTIEASSSIHQAKAVMDAEAIRHLPVTSEGRLVGMLSERDLKLAFAVAATAESGDSLHVGDVCNLEAYVVEYNTPLDQALMHLAEHRMSSALITRNGKLVGIITNTDIYRSYCEHLKIAFPDA
ncbi:MAG: CBS domain-containing protein [Pseudomonadota bacterium]|jgi:CBS domain-containing protein